MQQNSTAKEQILFLIGFMGCGKSTLGKKMAKQMEYTFVDLDDCLVKKAGMSINQYFEKYGESAFRALEKEVLQSLAGKSRLIVATGGGTPCFYDNMEWMNSSGKTLYIQLSPRTLASRLSQGEASKRPLIKDKSAEELLNFITETLQQRERYYLQAQVIVDGLQYNPKQLIEKVNQHFSL